jgi:hypothetical protein
MRSHGALRGRFLTVKVHAHGDAFVIVVAAGPIARWAHTAIRRNLEYMVNEGVTIIGAHKTEMADTG